MSQDIFVELKEADFQEVLHIRDHQILMDAEKEFGGQDTGPSPHDLLAGALASCKSMTMRMYAKRKGWNVEGLKVTVVLTEVDRTHTRFDVEIELPFHLNVEEKERLIEISKKCPVHRMISGQVEIVTNGAPA